MYSLNRLFNDGTISQEHHNKFYNAAHFYFKDSLKYIQEKFPVNNVISNSVWIDLLNAQMFHGKIVNIF